MQTRVVLCSLIALVSTGSLAQIASEPKTESSTSKPVAYVYVSRPTHIDGFAASSSGKLTPVPGSPLANTKVTALSVTKKFLLGETGDGQSSATSFSIASNGSLKKVETVDTLTHLPLDSNACADYPDTQVDSAGETLYLQENPNCETNGAYLVYHIASNGDLDYMGNSGGYIDGDSNGSVTRLHFLSTGNVAYDTYCGEDEGNLSVIDIYKRQSNGMLEYSSQSNLVPAPGPSGDPFCAGGNATDSSNHVAVALQQIQGSGGDNGPTYGPYYLATYTADSEGNLTTKSTAENMPEAAFVGQYTVNAMSIDPTSKFLAVGGAQGFEIYHFNGSSPITHYSGVLQSSVNVQQFGWDKSNHLYVLGSGNLYVYTVTSSEIKESSGSPYSIPESADVKVLDLQ